MRSLLISACLLGENCKYSGGNNALPEPVLQRLRDRYILVPVCPEVMGGLSTPRLPSERKGGRVINSAGIDVTSEYQTGAEAALKTAAEHGCGAALLKERSPSCGFGKIYDGSFSGKLIDGNGVTADLLSLNGIAVIGESAVNRLTENIE